MKCIQVVFIGLLLTTLGQNATAQSPVKLVLDYDVQAESCPTAERFSDGVSSKLGFVPWSQSGDRLRVRIREEEGEFIGTLELPDGSAKVLRDTTCPALIESLASAVSVALDRGTPKIQSPTDKQTSSTEQTSSDKAKATVHVASNGEGLTVSIIKGTSNVGTVWRELCDAPCTFNLEPGRREVMISGKGPSDSLKLNLVAGNDTYLVATPGSEALYYGGWV